MATDEFICKQTTAILPTPSGGTVSLRRGQKVVGAFYRQFIRIGVLKPADEVVVRKPGNDGKPLPKEAPASVPPPPAPDEDLEPEGEPEPEPEEEPEPEPEPEEEVPEEEGEEPEEEVGQSPPLAELKGMVKADLKALCSEHGLPTGGSKSALVSRLANELSSE